MEKLQEIEVIGAVSEWLKDAETLDVMRQQPVISYEKLPSLSIQAEVAVAVKVLENPREKTGRDDKDYAFVDVELVEPALLWTKDKGQYDGAKGTKASINLKRHASLYRAFKRLEERQGGSLKDTELVIANLGKRTFKTDKAPKGKATGYDYRVVLLAELKKKLGKK